MKPSGNLSKNSTALSKQQNKMLLKSLKKCSSKFFNLRGAKLSRKFLQNGCLPVHEAKRKCIACLYVESINKPNTNIAPHNNNARKEVVFECQFIQDQEIWARGDNVFKRQRRDDGKEPPCLPMTRDGSPYSRISLRTTILHYKWGVCANQPIQNVSILWHEVDMDLTSAIFLCAQCAFADAESHVMRVWCIFILFHFYCSYLSLFTHLLCTRLQSMKYWSPEQNCWWRSKHQ